MSNTLRTLLPLAVIVSILIGYNFISAQWTPAPGAPTGGNTAAPINVSSTTQAKAGNLASYILAATHQMRSNQYCDAMGGNCFSATNTAAGLPDCAIGQVLMVGADGKWGCGTAGTSGGSGHTDAECTALGGTPLTVSGQRICRVNAASCPSGWQPFQSWSTYASQSCGNSCGVKCSTGGLAWANNSGAIPQCLAANGKESQGSCDGGNTFICNAIRNQIGCY